MMNRHQTSPHSILQRTPDVLSAAAQKPAPQGFTTKGGAETQP